jgi:hypothetical protein
VHLNLSKRGLTCGSIWEAIAYDVFRTSLHLVYFSLCILFVCGILINNVFRSVWQEWERPKPGRRPDIFPLFSPMKTPLPPPLPYDPPEEDEEDEEKKEEEEEDPDKEEPEQPEKQ